MGRTPRTTVAGISLGLVALTAACSHSTRKASPAPPSAPASSLTAAVASATAGSAPPVSSAPASSAAASSVAAAASTGTATTSTPTPSTSQPSTPAAPAAPAKPAAPPAPKPAPPPPAPPVGGGVTSSVALAGTSCRVFPADNYWHADIRSLPVSAHNAAWMSAMGSASRKLHPDFGPSGGAVPYGIPITVAPAGTPRVAVAFDYADESDKIPYPLGAATKIEGGANSGV